MVQALYVSDGLMDILGLSPLAGRDFAAEEHVRGGPRAVLVSSSIWRQVGGVGVPDGRSITLNGETYAVVGLLSQAAQLPGTPGDIWIPFAQNQFADARQVTLMTVFARLALASPRRPRVPSFAPSRRASSVIFRRPGGKGWKLSRSPIASAAALARCSWSSASLLHSSR